ncbi:hypothetical protein LOC68_19300 [Blastopirellula sp. JC732]|uniref:Uncharacterized protein n=1 Tax=Blastopirellula sediminis TaxID=2894196 RepID=A0A9X1MNR5_9BACT|nr:hypothetical protein [Blastopirellula sediminis]MCC9606153.1 hypothetical protein [Blastopirellula sediminis]MCC9630548.1 hypothetical protein [Blastopirellula sediminis]
MLFDDYAKSGRLSNLNFAAPASKEGQFVYRGDWAIRGDFDKPLRDRRPPSETLTQAVAVSDGEKLFFLSGAFTEIELLKELTEIDAELINENTLGVIFARDIGTPQTVIIGGATFQLLPYADTMVWNELLDLLYLEKEDLKGLSREDKVILVWETAKKHNFKSTELTWEQVLESRIEPEAIDRVGAI